MSIRQYAFIGLLIFICFPVAVFIVSALLMEQADANTAAPKIEGIFWQVDQMSQPSGNWQLLGVDTLVNQWSIVDGRSFFNEIPVQPWDVQPDWQHIGKQPWAKHVILGLAGIFQEPVARENIDQLYQQSRQIIQAKLPVPVTSYYFPVEADPTWNGVHTLGQYIAQFKLPVWVSIYSAEPEAPFLEYWLESWLPPNAKVFFQDGVGVGTRSPEEAAQIYGTLKEQFGEDRVVIILEAFRLKKDGTFRAAYPWEISKQLKAYSGQRIFIFDGPHYLNRASVLWLYIWMKINF